MQSSLIQIMSGVVCLYTMPWNNFRWDAAFEPGFTSFPPPSTHPLPPRPAPPLSVSDTRLHAHPREATLATTRSLEEKRRIGVRMWIYMWDARHSSAVRRHYSSSTPPVPYFIFSDNIQFETNGARVDGVNVHGCVVVGGWGWKRVGGGVNDTIMFWVAAFTENYTEKWGGAMNTSKQCNLIKTIYWNVVS